MPEQPSDPSHVDKLAELVGSSPSGVDVPIESGRIEDGKPRWYELTPGVGFCVLDAADLEAE